MLSKGQGWNSSTINKQHQDRKKGPDNKSFNTWPMACLLVRPLRGHAYVAIPNSTTMTWLLAALLCFIGYLLGPQQKRDQNKPPLGGQGKGACASLQHIRQQSLSEWGLHWHNPDPPATSVQPRWVQCCYANVYLMPWQFLGISIKTTNQLLLRCDDSLQIAAAS